MHWIHGHAQVNVPCSVPNDAAHTDLDMNARRINVKSKFRNLQKWVRAPDSKWRPYPTTITQIVYKNFVAKIQSLFKPYEVLPTKVKIASWMGSMSRCTWCCSSIWAKLRNTVARGAFLGMKSPDSGVRCVDECDSQDLWLDLELNGAHSFGCIDASK